MDLAAALAAATAFAAAKAGFMVAEVTLVVAAVAAVGFGVAPAMAGFVAGVTPSTTVAGSPTTLGQRMSLSGMDVAANSNQIHDSVHELLIPKLHN